MLSRCRKPQISSRYNLPVALIVVIAGTVGRAGAATVADTRSPFPQPSYLESRVSFWVKIFSDYSSRDFLVHDRDEVSRIYQVLHLPGSGSPSAQEVARVERYLKNKYAHILDRLATQPKPIGRVELGVAALFRDASPSTYSEAARNLRVQQGLRKHFSKSMMRSVRYRRMMEEIFTRKGLPKELIVLAAIESGFNPRARSHAGAVGIWQFIRPTGRRYLRIDRHRDERLNPVRATEAAAKLLRSHYERLDSWPLAITAYNYGGHGMARAAEAFDGDYERILEDWDGPRFGFAVKNYYAEFLAALRLYQDESRHSSEVEEMEPPPILAQNHPARNYRARNYRVRRGDTLSRIARRFGISVASLRNANGVRDARRLTPGRRLSIPRAGDRRYARGGKLRYRIRRGDTLYGIARRSGVSMQSLLEANQVDDPRSLSVGATLSIPGA